MMLKRRLPIRKYQAIASVAAVIGFVLGVSIPAFAFSKDRWSCPFGSGLVPTVGFVLLTGILSAIVVGNLSAVGVIATVKFRQASSAFRKKKQE